MSITHVIEVVSGFILLAGFIVLFSLYQQFHRRYAGITEMMLAWSILIVALLLVGLSFIAPNLVSFVIGPFGMILGFVFLLCGLGKFLNQPVHKYHYIALLAAVLVLTILFTYIHPSFGIRTAITNLAAAIIMFNCGWLAWHALSKRTPVLNQVFYTYIIIMLLFLFRGIRTLFLTYESPELFTSDVIETFSVLLLELLFLFQIHNLSLMVNERLLIETNDRQKALDIEANRRRILMTGSRDGIAVFDDDGNVKEVNPHFAEMLGYHPDEMCGTNCHSWNKQIPPEQFKETLASVDEKGILFETVLQCKDGSCMDVEVMMNGAIIDNRKHILWAARDITERKAASEQLRQHFEEETKLRRRLEEEMKRRAEFTRALVHELKTPLTPMIASSEGLASIIREEPARSMAENVNRGAWNLDKRINELLELAKSELKVLEIHPRVIDLLPILREISSEMTDMAMEFKQELNLEIPETLPLVTADPDRIRQVIQNLITNAMKFTGDGGRILLSAGIEEGAVTIAVSDNGPGLTKAEIERLFTPYYRKETDREHLSGLGLGLALCKTFIDLHGGSIWVESTPGEGSVFTFSLPVVTPDKDSASAGHTG